MKKEITKINKTVLDERAPVQISIDGNIDSVKNWLEKRVRIQGTYDPLIISNNDETEMESIVEAMKDDVRAIIKDFGSGNVVIQGRSNIIVNRDKMIITLTIDEMDPFNNGTVVGKLQKHPDFEKWAINEGSEFSNKRLAEFVKMNRSSFQDKKEAMKLSASLMTLKVKVDKEIEKSNDNRANIRSMISQKVIELNIPESFRLNIPIFKGEPKVSFEVELYVNPNTFDISLISPDVNDLIQSVKDTVIDEQIKAIKEIAEDIVIIEQ